MPSFIKHLNSKAKGVQKVHVDAPKHFFHGFKKPSSYLNYFIPQRWCAPAPAPAPEPVSSTFDTNDCIWYYGTLYVKEAVAVEKMQEQRQSQDQQSQDQQSQDQQSQDQQSQDQQSQLQQGMGDDDDDTSSCTGSIGSAFKHPRSIGKQNQLKHLKDGMRLRHLILVNRANHGWNEWFATFDAETNRIIRTPDGVAFDTLRQFARLHHNEIVSMDMGSINVWSDPHFQYHDDATGEWHPLADLKH
jgi:hypothetical protein